MSRHTHPQIVGALAGLALVAACSTADRTPPASSTSTAVSTPPPQISTGSQRIIASDLPPLPFGVDRAVRAPEVVRATYEFAARHPEVLKYVPCFCSCERMGHKANDDCFVASRDADGKVTKWETHALGCEICLDVAQKAMQMHNLGASTAQIRDRIEKEFGSLTPNHTPTPMPPHKGVNPPSPEPYAVSRTP